MKSWQVGDCAKNIFQNLLVHNLILDDNKRLLELLLQLALHS